jgi:hypothetical protein
LLVLLVAIVECTAQNQPKHPPPSEEATKPMSDPTQSPHVPLSRLPWEPDSPSELLAASHILVITLSAVQPSAWAPEPASGLEQRELLLRVRLDAVLKGEVRPAVGSDFTVKVVQIREPGGVISDYHGFWSGVDPASGASYLVLSSGRTDDPGQLMLEPAIRLLVPSAQRTDVALAASAEERFAPLWANPATKNAALEELLKVAFDRRQAMGSLAPTYFLTRAATGDLRGGPLTEEILAIVLAPDTVPTLRSVLATGLANSALDQGATPTQRAEIARSLFGLATVKPAADLFERLATAELYNLIFEEDAPRIQAQDVIHDEAERVRLAATLKHFDDERADEIAAWLRHK